MTVQAMLNLLVNAVKFTEPDREIFVGASVNGKGGVDLFVRDQGIGMGAEDVERIGEPFLQADSGHSRRFEGAGLGLAIVKRLAELHDGELVIDSAPNEGTTATIRFPAGRVCSGIPNRSTG